MKKIIMIVAVAALAAVANANPVIYVVDIAQVHQHYYKTKSVQENLKSTIEATNSELQRMDEQLKALQAEGTAVQNKLNQPTLSEDAKKEIIEKELAPIANNMRNIEQTMQGMRTQAAQRIQKQQQEVIAEHRKEIVAVISKIAAEKKADFIIEKNACYFSKPTSDITEDVIAAVNASASKN